MSTKHKYLLSSIGINDLTLKYTLLCLSEIVYKQTLNSSYHSYIHFIFHIKPNNL